MVENNNKNQVLVAEVTFSWGCSIILISYINSSLKHIMYSLTALYLYIIENHHEGSFPCCCYCCVSDDLCPSC